MDVYRSVRHSEGITLNLFCAWYLHKHKPMKSLLVHYAVQGWACILESGRVEKETKIPGLTVVLYLKTEELILKAVHADWRKAPQMHNNIIVLCSIDSSFWITNQLRAQAYNIVVIQEEVTSSKFCSVQLYRLNIEEINIIIRQNQPDDMPSSGRAMQMDGNIS